MDDTKRYSNREMPLLSDDLFDFDALGRDMPESPFIESADPDESADSMFVKSASDAFTQKADASETEEKHKAPVITEPPVEIRLSDNAVKVLERRYLRKDREGCTIEEPADLFRRVAGHIASAELLHDAEADPLPLENEFFNMMARLEFMPNSPTLMNAGRELGQLSACFVLPVEDSMDSIFDAVKYTALIHKSGGGTGFSFSRIRPKNAAVQTTSGVASGPISFMHVFDEATETVKQGGTRRGANMAIMRIDHPDIMDFILCKQQDDKLNNFNISVAITDTFWTALEKNEDYELINPRTQEVAGTRNAKEVFDKIVHYAWKNGDPGVVFIDRINRDNPTPHLGPMESTNPCGEQPLLPYESCNLGSINLSKMVHETEEGVEIDWKRLGATVRSAVHFLDNVIDMNKYPLEQISKQTRATRKIGLGVMGFADLLMQLDIPYNSIEAIETAQQVMHFINDTAKRRSQELGIDRGPFPEFPKSVFAINNEPDIRNATRTTIAPTGTISIIAGCSSGIEPLFALSFYRQVMDDDKLPEVHPLFLERLKKENLNIKNIIQKVIEEGSCSRVKEIPESIRKVFVTSHEIEPEWHIRMQAAFQNFTDNAVSKTVNFSNTATEADIAKVYKLAHDLECKGVTIYRDGSREMQVLNKGAVKQDVPAPKPVATVETPKPLSIYHSRPRILRGFTTKLNTGQGSLYVTINTDETGIPVEVFANIGKSGGDTSALSEAIGRLISIGLQKGVTVEELSETLMGITGSRPVWNDGFLVKSVPDGIGQVLLTEFGDRPTVSHKKDLTQQSLNLDAKKEESVILGPECPECGQHMAAESGCATCHHCGYSHCS